MELPISLAIAASLLTLGVSIAAPSYAARDEAREYKACLKLTKHEPEAAFESALTWRDQGGGFPARHCAALALVEMKKYHLAAPRLEKLAEDMMASGSPHVVDLLMQTGNIWLLSDDPVRADAVFTAALKLEPDNIELLIDRSRALAKAENYQTAFEDLNHALKIDPTRPDVLAFRASAYRHLGDTVRALEDVELALTLAPGLIDALLERGILYRLNNLVDLARKDWLKVLELSPYTPAGELARINLEKLDVKK
jgi:tetratricopeptide (TPR) repeat protein